MTKIKYIRKQKKVIIIYNPLDCGGEEPAKWMVTQGLNFDASCS